MAMQIAPLIVPERRILIYLYLFVTGIILLHSLPALWHHGDQLVLLLSFGAFMILAAIFWRFMHVTVLTIVAPRYRCRSGKPIYNISKKTGYNHLIFVQKKSIKMISNSGLGQQVCPALQPLPC